MASRMRLLLGGFSGGWAIYSSLIGNPVYFPRLAPVLRIRLFEVRRIRGDVRPHKSNIDSSTLPEFLIVKLTASVPELADHRLNRLPQGGILAISPIDAPLMGLRIVNSQRQTLDMTGWAIGFKLLQVGAPVPDSPGDGSPIKLDPGRRADQAAETFASLRLARP